MSSTPDSGRWADKDTFTTGEAAAACGVSQQTIIRCFDSGRLHGFRVPGSRFRRIPRASLLTFMKANGIDPAPLIGHRSLILIASSDRSANAALTARIAEDGRFDIVAAETAFEAGVGAVSADPTLVLLDADLPGLDVPAGVRALVAAVRVPPQIVVLVADATQFRVRSLLAAGAREVLTKSSDHKAIADHIIGLAGA